MAHKNQDTKAPAATPKPVRVGDESLAERIAPHVKKILIGVVVLAVIMTIAFAFWWRKRAGQEATTARLAEVVAVGHWPVGPDLMGQEPKTEDRFATSKDRAIGMLAAMAKADIDGPPAYKGSLLLQADKLDEAVIELRKGIAAKDIDGVIAREGLGLALEAKARADKDNAAAQKLFEEALATFTTMQPDETGPRRAYALYHQGRMQQELNKPTEAKALYEKAKALGAATELPTLIERRLATL